MIKTNKAFVAVMIYRINVIGDVKVAYSPVGFEVPLFKNDLCHLRKILN